jgi:hypothetical protein
MKTERQRLGDAVTAHSAATALATPPVTYADTSAWQQGETGDKDQSYPYVELELTGSTTIAVTGLNAVAMVLDAVTVASDTFSTTHGSDLFTQTSHGFLTGDGPIRVTNSGGALPAGLAADTNYYVIKIDGDTFKVATSRANALAGTVVNLTGDGTGTHTYVPWTSGNDVFQRVTWLQVDLGDYAVPGSDGLLGIAGDGAVALTATKGYTKRFRFSPRWSGLALEGTLDTGNVTAKFRPLWFLE